MGNIKKILAGRKGGLIAGSRMTKDQRKARARNAALKRWAGKSKPTDPDEIIRKAVEKE